MSSSALIPAAPKIRCRQFSSRRFNCSLTAAIAVKRAFFTQLVMCPHRLDLSRSARLPLRPHQRGNCRNVGLGGMNHSQQYLDDDGRIRQRTRRRRRFCNQTLPCGNLGLGRRRLGADVQVELLNLGAADLSCHHKVMERVINTEPETILKLWVGMARRCLVDQMNDRTTQGPVTGKEHARVRPEAVCVERRGPRQCVVLARMAVAAEVSHPAEDSEDSPAGNVERASQFIEPGDRTVAEEVLEFLDIGIFGRVCHSYD